MNKIISMLLIAMPAMVTAAPTGNIDCIADVHVASPFMGGDYSAKISYSIQSISAAHYNISVITDVPFSEPETYLVTSAIPYVSGKWEIVSTSPKNAVSMKLRYKQHDAAELYAQDENGRWQDLLNANTTVRGMQVRSVGTCQFTH